MLAFSIFIRTSLINILCAILSYDYVLWKIFLQFSNYILVLKQYRERQHSNIGLCNERYKCKYVLQTMHIYVPAKNLEVIFKMT